MATAALVAAGGAGLLGAAQQVSAGRIAALEGKSEAKAIETQEAAREADRKEQLARALSSQSAVTGAGGISFEGSPLSVIEEDVRRAEEAKERGALEASIGASAARSRGKIAKKQAQAQAVTSLLGTGAQMGLLTQQAK